MNLAILLGALLVSGLQNPNSGGNWILEIRPLPCTELQHARAAEADWIVADAAVARAFPEQCSRADYGKLRKARDLSARRCRAYSEYYRSWEKMATGQSETFGRIAADRVESRKGLEDLLLATLREETRLEERRKQLRSAPRAGGDLRTASELQLLDRIQSLIRQRRQNLLEAISRWRLAQSGTEAAISGARNLAALSAALRRACESEAVLWDAYYEAREIRHRLRCEPLQDIELDRHRGQIQPFH